VFGGRSAEHEISVVSAKSVLRALDAERYDVLTIGIDKEGRWHRLDALPAGSTPQALPAVEDAAGRSVGLSRDPGDAAPVEEEGGREPIDVVFPLLHGPFGVDGTIQGMLDRAGVPYVGAGVLGSAVGMDKAVQKVLFRDAGLAVVPFEVVLEPVWDRDRDGVHARAQRLGYPMFVKPAALGSSVGITKVKEPEQLDSAMPLAFEYGRKALMERAMEGARETEIAVLGDDDPGTCVAGGIVASGQFYEC